MNRVRLICFLLSLIVCIGFLGGCGEISVPAVSVQTDNSPTSLEKTPDLDYEVPESVPGILVDQLGYSTESTKIAVFLGEEPGSEFQLVNAASQTPVYTGVLEEKGIDKVSGEMVCYGTFTDYDSSGNYYIENSKLGKSYTFSIGNKVYDILYKQIVSAIHNRRSEITTGAAISTPNYSGGWITDAEQNRDVVIGCRAIENMLLAAELYPDVFKDDWDIEESGNEIPDILDEVRFEINWLFQMQDLETGGVHAGIRPTLQSVSGEATALFAASMAKFGYAYQNYDKRFATSCLQAADKAWRYLEKYPQEVEKESCFLAATELYKASGAYKYHKYIKQVAAELIKQDLKGSTFYGAVNYASTKSSVDVALCNSMVKKMMLQAEEISASSKEDVYLAEGSMEDIVLMTVVDYIITNHEYATVIENHIHYLLGRNSRSICYINGVGSRSYEQVTDVKGVMEDANQVAECFVMLCELYS